MGCGAVSGVRQISPAAAQYDITVAAEDARAVTPEAQAQGRRSKEHSLTKPLSVSSHADLVSLQPTSAEDRMLKHLPATKATTEELKALFEGYIAGHPQAEKLQSTLFACIDMLAGGTGGVILAVVDKKLMQDLQFSYLDNGRLMNLCRAVCPNILEERKEFETMLHFFCKHSETDRWSQQELEGMATRLPEVSADDIPSLLTPLEHQPKDGAFIVSHSSTVVAACGHLKYSSERFQLVRDDGHSCGTRHAAALALAEWLGTSNTVGAVFVRSDGGGVHAMLPSSGGTGEPRVLHFDSLKDLGQEDMLKLFRERIMADGMLMQKVKPAMIRRALRGERVVTCVHGRVISEVDVSDDTSMVIQADTWSKELYVLSQEKFMSNWEPFGEDTGEGGPFKRHRPRKGIQRWIYKITASDIELVPTGQFKSAWGAVQPLREGDFLAMPAPEDKATEIYLMDIDAVGCYAKAGEQEEPKGCHLSQQDMLSTFNERIMRQGRLMKKVEPCMARPGRCGEQVVTCVQGRVTSDVTIQDETSMVIRAATLDQELYVLPQAKFLANWHVEPHQLDGSDHVKRLLAKQGFKLYFPKPNMKWVYNVTAADAKEVPTGCFYSAWGALQPIQAGDYLAIPAPKGRATERATEVYLMPKEVVFCLEEATEEAAEEQRCPEPAADGEKQERSRSLKPSANEELFKAVDQNGDGVVTQEELASAMKVLAEPAEVRPASEPEARVSTGSRQQNACSQEDIVRLFAGRILQRGRAVTKTARSLIRPGRPGDHVVTYVNGRVISDVVIENDTSWVVRASTVDQEEYVLSKEKFEANWEPDGEPLDEQDPVMGKLHERGFRLYCPKRNKKWVYRLTAADLESLPAQAFEASWGSAQPLREGDFLALAVTDGCQEVYLMPPDVLDCYTDFQEAEDAAGPPKDGDQSPQQLSDTPSLIA